VLCEVADRGAGFPDADRAGRSRPDPAAHGGRGLWLVRCVADELEIISNGTGTVATARLLVK
jgi:anti-sigma regulatory factor (Ser/Thr protein kinase)